MNHKKPMRIEAERLHLGVITEKDYDAMARIVTSEEVGKTYMLPVFQSEEAVRKLFGSFCRLSAMEERFVYGVFLGDTLIGFINDVEIKDGKIELGYVIDPYHKGRGYATEALTAAIKVLLDMGYDAVRTAAFEGNIPSIRVMEKSGMDRMDFTDELEYRGVTHRCVWFEKRKC